MGCDIFFYVEHKVNNEWEIVEYQHPFYVEALDWDMKNWGPIIRRNYTLFGLLGADKDWHNIQIMPDREGIPEDTSKFLKDTLDGEYNTYTNRSWLSLQEILSFDWKTINEKIEEVSFHRIMLDDEHDIDCKTTYKITYKEYFKDFFDKIIWPMMFIDKNYNNVRCVFAFST